MKIAILGLGTIGYGVYDILSKKDLGIKVKKVYDRLIREDLKDLYAKNLEEILEDKEIEVVVEAMGGLDFAYQVIKKALLNKKSVVTANKEVIARHIDELSKIKEEAGVSLYYEASVGGGVPIIKPLYKIKKTNEVIKIEGILNGTTNYILSKMNEGLDFNQALKKAQDLGFAESDPSSDIEGLDAMRKIAILAMIAYKKEVSLENITTYGITSISSDDINFLKKQGYSIKLVAKASSTNILVEPLACPKTSIFTSVENEYNAIKIKTDLYDELMFYGKGAGRYPTASAIVDDLISIKEKELNYTFQKVETFKQIATSDSYYIRVKDEFLVSKDLIKYKEGPQMITKDLYREDLDFNNIIFYARIGKEEEDV